jgi:Tol biopolymer transport system component
LSPDGKLLAYASDRAGKGNLDIWVQPAAGGDPVQLTHDESDELEPSFSPDGSQIAYRSEREGGGIYIVSSLGGEPRLVAREGRNPRFSPDGQQIAYWTGKGGRSEAFARQGGRVFVVPSSGGDPRQVGARIPHASTPTWSPDGRMLLFVGLTPREGIARNYTWFLTPAGEDRPVLTNADVVLGAPNGQVPTPSQWLPDNRVLCAARHGDSANLHKVLLDPAHAKVGRSDRLTFGGGLEDSPSLAAPGTAAFADLTWNYDLWSIPVDTRAARVTGEPVRLTESLAAETYPSLSDDGRTLAFVSARGPQSEIWVRDLNTAKSVRVRSLAPGSSNVLLSHDGSAVVYLERKDGKRILYTVPSSGGLPQRITDRDQGGATSWTPSGSIVHYLGRTQTGVLQPKKGDPRVLLDPKVPGPTYQTSFSPDEKWITFIRLTSQQTTALFVAPATGAWPVPESAWIKITDGTQWEDKPRWSPDGNLLYFTSERDGYRCIWVQRLAAGTRTPAGAAFALYHSHSSRRSMLNVTLTGLEIALGPDKIVFVQGEVTGNIWRADLQAAVR